MSLKLSNEAFSNRKTITSTVVFLLLVALVSLSGLNQVNQRIRSQTIDSLQAVLDSTHATIHDVWLNNLFLEANSRASESVVINSTKALLATNRRQSALLKHSAQQKLRDYFYDYLKQRDALGIFIITRDAISIASMRDSNIGQQNLIQQYYPERLERVFLGQQQFIPPIPSDVPLSDDNGQMVESYPTMFIMVPIKNKQGQVLAALSVRLNPFDAFTKIAQTGRISESGETYLFDKQGRMITESRFNEQLRKLGILKQGDHSILNLHFSEPGNNLKEVNKLFNTPEQQSQSWIVKKIIEKYSAGGSNVAYQDYRGVPVLGVGTWDKDLGIGFVSEIDEYEAMEPYRQMQVIVVSMLIAIVLLGTAFFYILNRFRQQSIAELANSEAYLSVVLDNAIDGIITINKKGIIQTFNSAAEKLFGYSQSEVINKNVSMLVPEPHKSKHDLYLENYQTTNEAKIIGIGRNVDALRKDGSCFPMRLGISETWLDNKQIFTGIIHDLTEQKQAEDALRKSEGRFREIYESSPIPYQSLNAKGDFVDVNKAFLNILGYTYDEIIGTNFVDIMDEESAMRAPHMLQQFKKDKKIHCEFVLLSKDGEMVDIEVQGVIANKYDGSFRQTHCVWHDVSERKKVEKEFKRYQEKLETLVSERTEKLNEKTIELQNEHKNLLKSERLYRGLLEAAPDSIILVNELGNIELVNKTVTKMFGFTPEELLGKPVEVMLPEKFKHNHKQLRKNYTKKPYIRESHTVNMLFGQHKNGTQFPADISLSPIETENGPMIICDIRDISERMKLGEQLQQSQKMEAIGQLTGGIAHDFNNILACILGYTTLALELDENAKKEKLDKYLKAVYSSGERARDLISKMMDFSRKRSGNTNQLLNLTELLDEIISMLRPVLPSSIDIVCNIDSDVFEIMGEPAQIIQVVTNLCVNARDGLQEHGCIQLELHKVVLTGHVCNSCHKHIVGDFIEIRVTDNGTGIDVKKLENIFDPFFTTKEVGKGTGMGLSMVHGIMHECGGHIIVDSTIGKGTTFSLLFSSVDVGNVVNESIEDTPESNVLGDGQHILVVDDEEVIGLLLEEVLTDKNYKVTVFTNSKVALDYYIKHQSEIDMIITDQTMPGLTGTEMAHEISKLNKDIPIILCSGYLTLGDENKIIPAGIKKLLLKPIDLPSLLHTVHDLIEH